MISFALLILSVECLKNIAGYKNTHCQYCQLILVNVVVYSIKILLICRRMVNHWYFRWMFFTGCLPQEALEKEMVLLLFTFEKIKRQNDEPRIFAAFAYMWRLPTILMVK